MFVIKGERAKGAAWAEDGGGEQPVQAGAPGAHPAAARAPGQGGRPVRRGVHQAGIQVRVGGNGFSGNVFKLSRMSNFSCSVQ